MWPIVGTALFAVWVAVKEIRALRQQGLIRELVVFLLLMAVGSGYVMAYILQIPLQNPVEWINAIYMPVSDFFFQLI